jgi:hypothetical protein
MDKTSTKGKGVLHFDDTNYEKEVSRATHIAQKFERAYAEATALCKSQKKSSPSLEAFLDNPKLATEAAIMEGFQIKGAEISNTRALQLMEVGFNFLNEAQLLVEKKHYSALKAVNGAVEFETDYIEEDLKEQFTERCQTPQESYLHKLLKRLYASTQDIKNTLEDNYDGGPAGFNILTGNILFWNEWQKKVLINVPKFRELAKQIQVPEEIE